jgi:hypothetical protein
MFKFCFVLFLAVLGSLLILTVRTSATTSPALPASLQVIENVGQFDPRAWFLVQGDVTIWVTDDGLWLTIPDRDQTPARPAAPNPTAPNAVTPTGHGPVQGTSFHLTFPGRTPTLEPFARQESVISYFTPDGSFPAVPVWGGVRMGLGNGLSLEISGQAGQPALVLTSTAEASRDLSLHIEGADDFLLENGQPILTTANGAVALPLQTTAPLTLHATTEESARTFNLQPPTSPLQPSALAPTSQHLPGRRCGRHPEHPRRQRTG